MSEVQSNIDSYYEEMVDSMAERAIGDMSDGGYEDEVEAIWQEIDDGLMFYCDQGYVLAMACCRGYIDWYKDVKWDEITEMLYEDVSEAYEYKKKQQEDK